MSRGNEGPSRPRLDGNARIVTGDRVVDRALDRSVEAALALRWAEEVRAWAVGRTAFLRTKAVIRREVASEYLVLVEALGGWACADPRDFFPAPSPGRGPFDADERLEW